MMNKICNYYKIFGIKETIKKILRYCSYLCRFTRDESYYHLSNTEKKNIILKNKKIYLIANSFDYLQVSPFIDVLNTGGYKVIYCSYDNVYLKERFLNISSQIKFKKFDNRDNSKCVISFKNNIEGVECIFDSMDIDNVVNCNNLYEKVNKNNFLQNEEELISIIVLNYNNKNIIFKCINSIIKNSKRYNYELIIVDNCSVDGSYEELLNNKNIKLYRNNKNGCSSGRNLGINKAKGKYLLFLDSDQYPQNSYWLDEYLEILKKNNNSVIGWTGGWLNNKYYSGKTVDFYEYRFMPPIGLYRSDIGYLGTGGMFCLKQTLLKTKLFDLMYDPTCYEDTDISFQLKNVNVKLIYSPCLGIIHDEHQTTNSGSDEHAVLINEKGKYFKDKWSKININLLKNGVK